MTADAVELRYGDILSEASLQPLPTITLAEVQPRAVEWLWPSYVPLGKITLLDGDPGLGKSSILLDLAARGSRGQPTPTGEALNAFDTIIVTTEDDAEDTIRPRLDVIGADVGRIHLISDLTLPDEADRLAATIELHQARLVYLDPIVEFLDGRVRTASDHAVRRALKPMVQVSADLHCATVGIRHLSKEGGRAAVYRGGGSIGFAGLARAHLAVGRDPDDANRNVLASIKVSVGAAPPSLAYRLVAADKLAPVRIEWLGPSDHSAEALIGAERDEARMKSKSEQMGEAIRQLVARNGGEMLARDGWAALEAEGFDVSSNDVKYRALHRVVEVKKTGFKEPWVWRLK
jgi:hypothetical protein